MARDKTMKDQIEEKERAAVYPLQENLLAAMGATSETPSMKDRLISRRSSLLNDVKKINNALQQLELSNAEEVLKDAERVLYS
jgi:hypothetical protein